MLYIQHNIKSNYQSAAGSGDREMAFDILLSEIAKLIIYKPKVLIQELKNAGFPLKSDSPNRKELIKAVSDALYKSLEFAKAVARQIMLNQKPMDAQADGDEAPDYANILSGTSNLTNGLGELFGGKSKELGVKLSAEKALTDKIKAIDEFNGKVAPVGRIIFKWVLISVLVGGSIYLIYRAAS